MYRLSPLGYATTCRFKYSTLSVLPVLPVPVLYCTGTNCEQLELFAANLVGTTAYVVRTGTSRIDQVSHTCRISPVLQYRYHCTAVVVLPVARLLSCAQLAPFSDNI